MLQSYATTKQGNKVLKGNLYLEGGATLNL